MEPEKVTALVERLERAEERGTLLAVLTDFKKGFTLADRWQAGNLAKILLSSASRLSKYLTAAETSSSIASVLSSLDPVTRILVLYSLFNQSQSEDQVYNFLLSALQPEHIEAVLKGSVTAAPDDARGQYEEVVSCLVSLPDKLSNFLKRLEKSQAADLRSWIRAYPTAISIALRPAIQFAADRVNSSQDVNLRAVSLLVSKGRNLNVQNSSLLDETIHWICRHESSSPIWDRLAQRIFTDDSHGVREYEAMLAAVIHAVRSGTDLLRCIGYAAKTKSGSIQVTFRRLLLQRVCPYSVPRVLADYLAKAGLSDVFLSFLTDLVGVWSDVTFVRFNPDEKQQYLTVGVLEFGRRVNDLGLETSWRNLALIIANGVHLRLGNSDPTVQQTGLFVGEQFSKWQGAEDPMKFDYQEDEWLRTMRGIAEGELEEKTKESEEILEPEPSTSYSLPDMSKLTVRQRELDSDDEIEFEGEYIPEEERHVEKLKEGEEPEKHHTAPNYIRDAMDWLAETERYEKFEAALFHLEPMIRRNAIGLADIAPKLVQRLIHLDDKFCTKDFERIRRDCVIALLVQRPELAPSLGENIFSRNCTFFTRYLILNCLIEAAKELSEPPKKEKLVKEIEQENVIDPSDWRSVVDARIRLKTRIISEKKPEPVVHVNRFAPVATMFFYPLLTTSTGEHLELRGKDAPFLAKLLVAAAEILQCGSTSQSVVKMAASLSNHVWPLRFHDETAIRTAVLFSYFSIISALPAKVLFEVFAAETDSWLQWMCSVAENGDLAEQERTLARHAAAVFVDKSRSAKS